MPKCRLIFGVCRPILTADYFSTSMSEIMIKDKCDMNTINCTLMNLRIIFRELKMQLHFHQIFSFQFHDASERTNVQWHCWLKGNSQFH